MVMEVKDPPPPSAPRESKGSVADRLIAVGSIFLPKPLQEAYKQGLLPLLGYILLAIVVFPLVVVFLAAFWLSMAKNSGIEVLRLFHESYVKEIQKGFSIDDFVRQNNLVENARLDYVQLIEVMLHDQTPPKTYPIRVMKGQRVTLQFTDVWLNPPPIGSCPFQEPSRGIDVLDVKIGRQVFKSCGQTTTRVGGCIAELGAKEWEKYRDEFEHGDDPQQLVSTLTFLRASSLNNSCNVLYVQGSLAVYKGDVGPPATR